MDINKKLSENFELESFDSDSSDIFIEDKIEKKIYPVYNENNFYITKEIIQSILQKGNINREVNDLSIWQQAFVHKSYCKNNDFKKNEKFFGSIDSINIDDHKNILPLQNDSNEVLEWLGDGIIQSVAAIYLYKRFKTQREGFLTKIRSKLVKTESLSKLALYLGFDKYLIISKHIEIICNGRKNSRILEDCFEAFIGAMMNVFGHKNESDGFTICNMFIINIIEQKIDITDLIINDDNFKDQLMRFYQKKYNGKFPIYEQKTLITTTNENGIVNKKFHMFVRDNDNNIIGEGIARSKKEAEQKAAKAALMHFGISNGY
jgi:ribonuclease-3